MLASSFRHSFLSTVRPFQSKSALISRAICISSVGEEKTTRFRIKFNDNNRELSPWHDIPLKANDHLYNFIVEIPKHTRAKMEVSTKEPFNPIAQDLKKGKLRDYNGPIFWNYGCLPQTWENPHIVHPEVKCKGDNDPLDVVEIGSAALPVGSVVPVKVLGVLAMVDDGELDWKLIAIAASDPLAAQLNDIPDLQKIAPEVITGIREWFRWYKTPDGKPLNSFGFREEALPRSTALHVIEETHAYWRDLVSGKTSPVTEGGTLWVPPKK